MPRLVLTLTVFSCLVISSQASFAQIEATLKLIPNDANAISIVNVEKIYGSEMAAREKWIEESKVKYANSPLYFPTNTESVVMAAEFDLAYGSAMWEAAHLTMKYDIQMDTVAELCNGTLDKLGGYECVDTGGGGTLLKLNNKTLATKFPANRQQIGRWARAVRNSQTGDLSPYLMGVAKLAKSDSDAEIIMGIDLVDAVNPNLLREKLDRKKWGEKTDDMIKILSSLQGVTFEVRLKNAAQGILRVDFAEDATPLASVAKEFIIAGLKEKGLYIKDVDNWVADTNGKQISFKGRLTSSGLRRVSSIIEPPRVPISSSEMSSEDRGDIQRRKALATKEHWDAVQALLKDLRNYQPQTRNQLAFYYERYARKIDNLPILNVDDEELDFAAEVANILRQVALGRRDVVARTAAVDKQYRGYNSTYTYGAHGWVGNSRSAQSSSEAASANIIAAGATSKAKLMEGLDQMNAETRRSLTKKYSDYQIEF